MGEAVPLLFEVWLGVVAGVKKCGSAKVWNPVVSYKYRRSGSLGARQRLDWSQGIYIFSLNI